MTANEIRLECLRLAVPRDVDNPSVSLILARAKAYEAFVIGDGIERPRKARTAKPDAVETMSEHGPD